MSDEAERADGPRLIVLTDGRAGNENPALGLAETLARRRAAAGAPAWEIETLRAPPAPWAAAAPAAAWDALERARAGAAFAAVADPALRARLRAWRRAGGPAGVLIGAGRRAAPLVAALRAGATRLAAVQLLAPRMPHRRFDLVIAPAHDRIAGPALRTLGSLHRIAPERLAAAADPRVLATRAPRLGVLIGGPSRSAGLDDGALAALGDRLARLAREGAGLAVTASRRTPEAARAALAARVAGAGGLFWEGGGANPYESILAHADALIVTADSVNMASEAAASGKPVWIARLGGLSPKLERFHAALAAGGHARALEPAADLAALIGAPAAPLDDMARAAAAVEALAPAPAR